MVIRLGEALPKGDQAGREVHHVLQGIGAGPRASGASVAIASSTHRYTTYSVSPPAAQRSAFQPLLG
jgi:hypothetical protein